MNDTQLEFAWGEVVEVEERSRHGLASGLTTADASAFDPGLSGRRDTSSPAGSGRVTGSVSWCRRAPASSRRMRASPRAATNPGHRGRSNGWVYPF